MNLLQRMLTDLPFSKPELQTLIRTAPYRYKVYKIPKRQPKQFRTIAQPSPEIKIIQHWLMKNVLSSLPVHKAATAYRLRTSIADHAAIHVEKRFLLKMDFTNFFPSISSDDIQKYLIQSGRLSVEDSLLACRIVSWLDKPNGKFCLSIGAPSSPQLSNAMLYTFDKKMTEIVRREKVFYSRYADDLAFSTNQPEVLATIAEQVKRVCDELDYPRLQVNHSKTVSTSRAFRRTLVGLVLTPLGEISLGREKKRRIRSELYRFSQGRLAVAEVPRLRGELAFAWSVEKTFINTLIRQFGVTIFRLLDLPFGEDER